MRHLSTEQLKTLASLCGGMAALMFAVVVLSSPNAALRGLNPATQAASYVGCVLSDCDTNVYGVFGYFYPTSATIGPGQSTTLNLNWHTVNGTMAVSNICVLTGGRFNSETCNAYAPGSLIPTVQTGHCESVQTDQYGQLTGTVQDVISTGALTSNTTYTLTCSHTEGGPSVSATVTVDPCTTAAWQPWSNGVYVIGPGDTEKVSGAQTFCVTNSSGNWIVIPGGGSYDPSGQLSTFRTYAGNVGVTTF